MNVAQRVAGNAYDVGPLAVFERTDLFLPAEQRCTAHCTGSYRFHRRQTAPFDHQGKLVPICAVWNNGRIGAKSDFDVVLFSDLDPVSHGGGGGESLFRDQAL